MRRYHQLHRFGTKASTVLWPKRIPFFHAVERQSRCILFSQKGICENSLKRSFKLISRDFTFREGILNTWTWVPSHSTFWIAEASDAFGSYQQSTHHRKYAQSCY